MLHYVVLLGTFVITWFLALFCLLPIGQRDDAEPTIKLSTKFMVAAAIAVVGWGIFYGLIQMGVLAL